MLNIQKSSLILILIIVVLIAGFVSLVTLGYTPGSVWHKAEDIKPGEVGKSVGATATSTYLFPNLEAKSQVTAGTNFHVGATTITSGKVTGLDIPTNANDAATKAYVDEVGANGKKYITVPRTYISVCTTTICAPPEPWCPDGWEIVESEKYCYGNASSSYCYSLQTTATLCSK